MNGKRHFLFAQSFMLLLPICGAFFLLYPLTTLALLTALTALRRGRVIVGFYGWPRLFFGTLFGKEAMVLCTYTSINFKWPSTFVILHLNAVKTKLALIHHQKNQHNDRIWDSGHLNNLEWYNSWTKDVISKRWYKHSIYTRAGHSNASCYHIKASSIISILKMCGNFPCTYNLWFKGEDQHWLWRCKIMLINQWDN